MPFTLRGVETRDVDFASLIGVDFGDHILIVKDRTGPFPVKVTPDRFMTRMRASMSTTKRVLLVKPADYIVERDPDEPYGDEHRVPMQYRMTFERDGIATRYHFQLNDLVTTMLITDDERHFADFPRTRAHRASICESVLWQAVKKKRPIYFERAKALGWVT